MAYISLREKSRFLKNMTKSAGRDIRDDEVTVCENRADAYIEGKLGKSFDSTAVPVIIEEIADLLASARAWRFLHVGQSPKKSEFVQDLKDEAEGMLDKILSGDLGVKNTDGSWDKDFPGDRNMQEKRRRNIQIIV